MSILSGGRVIYPQPTPTPTPTPTPIDGSSFKGTAVKVVGTFDDFSLITHPFVIDPEVRNLARDAGIKYIRLAGFRNPVTARKIGELVRNKGMIPYLTLPIPFKDTKHYENNLAIVRECIGVIEMFELGGEPMRPNEYWNVKLGFDEASTKYATHCRDFVEEALTVNPNAMFAVGNSGVYDWEPPAYGGDSKQYWDKSIQYMKNLVIAHPENFWISMHYYPSGNAVVNSNWEQQKVLDRTYGGSGETYASVANQIRNAWKAGTGVTLPVSYGETNWNTNIGYLVSNGVNWSNDEAFLREYVRRAKQGCEAGDVWFHAMWNFCGAGKYNDQGMIDGPDEPRPIYTAYKDEWG
jgi:hypothetical protein